MPNVYTRTLRRAAHILGGAEEFAAQLDVAESDLVSWFEGTSQVPQDIFLRAVDIVVAHKVLEISGKHPTLRRSTG